MITSAVPTQYQNVTSANNSYFSNVIKFFTSLNPRDVPLHLQQKGQAVDYPKFTLTSGGSGHIFTAAMNLLPLAIATLCPLELQHVAKFFCNSYSIFQMFSSGSKEKTSEIPSTEKKRDLEKKDECREITKASYPKTKTITNGNMFLLALSGLLFNIPRSQAAPTLNTTPTSDKGEKTSAHNKTIELSTIEKLQKIGNDPAFPLNGKYELTANIDGENLTSIGDYRHPFVGSFDGNSHHIDHTKHCIFGLIGNGGEVKNLISEHAEIYVRYQQANGGTNGGTIACRQHKGGTIDSVLVKNATVESHKKMTDIGLIVGANGGCIKNASVSDSSVTAHDSHAYIGFATGLNQGEIIDFTAYNNTMRINGPSTSAAGVAGYQNLGFTYKARVTGNQIFIHQCKGIEWQDIAKQCFYNSISSNNEILANCTYHSDTPTPRPERCAKRKPEIIHTAMKPYIIEIGSPEDLQQIGQDPESPSDGIYVLTASINGENLTSIGNANHPFEGYFYGNSYSINNTQQCIFKFIGPNGVVKNLTVGNSQILPKEGFFGDFDGVIACRQSKEGIIDSVQVKNATMENTAKDAKIGLVVGENNGTIFDSSVINSSILNHGENAAVGFAAGVNRGRINGFYANQNTVQTQHRDSIVGGVTGSNEKTGIIHTPYVANSNLSGQSDKGSLDIAGINQGLIYNPISLNNTISTNPLSKQLTPIITFSVLGSAGAVFLIGAIIFIVYYYHHNEQKEKEYELLPLTF